MGHVSAEIKTSRDSPICQNLSMGRKNPAASSPHHHLLLAVEILGSALPSLSFSFLFQVEEEVRLKIK